MRVLVATSDVTFVEGGHLVIARELVKALKRYGHEADLLLTPQNRFSRVILSYFSTRLIDAEEDGIGRKIEKLITLRAPSYVLKHENQTLWINHRVREYYDLWEKFYKTLSRRAKVKELFKKRIIHFLDSHYLRKVKKIYSQSENIKKRLRRWGGIESEVLYPPPPERNYTLRDYENSVFTVSRLVNHKRVDLIIKAFSYIKNKDIKLKIAGEGPEEENLKKLAKELGIDERVCFLRRISEEKLVEEYSRCGLVFYSPYSEDYGFVTVEAFSSEKPVLTTEDSGGVRELVEKSQGGYILATEPSKIGKKIEELFSDKKNIEDKGKKAKEWVKSLSWEKTVEKLIS